MIKLDIGWDFTGLLLGNLIVNKYFFPPMVPVSYHFFFWRMYIHGIKLCHLAFYRFAHLSKYLQKQFRLSMGIIRGYEWNRALPGVSPFEAVFSPSSFRRPGLFPLCGKLPFASVDRSLFFGGFDVSVFFFSLNGLRQLHTKQVYIDNAWKISVVTYFSITTFKYFVSRRIGFLILCVIFISNYRDVTVHFLKQHNLVCLWRV